MKAKYRKYIQQSLVFISISLFNIIYTSATATTETVYDVEVIIFSHARAEHLSSENWKTEWTLPDLENSIRFKRNTTTAKHNFEVPQLNFINAQKKFISKNPIAKEFKLHKAAERTLTEAFDKLNESKKYEVLAHTAWRQPATDAQTALSVRLQGGELYTVRQVTPDYITHSELTTINPTEENNQIKALTTSQLDGTIKIVVSRFLHVYTDFLLSQPVKYIPIPQIDSETGDLLPPKFIMDITTADNEDAVLHGFNIKEHRRMRSSELHHIDHPLIGILVKATPQKIEVPDEAIDIQ